MVDTCVGADKERSNPQWHHMQSPWEANFAALGLKPADIDFVFCTHLHADHIGWNTCLRDGRWVPTFPNAKYVMADRELAYWTQREKDDPASCPWITDSVLPIVAAGREQVVTSDFALDDAVRLTPTPGHTIDHFSVLVGRSGRDAFITGDMIHSPLQGKYPEMGMRVDYDSAQAGATRRKIFDHFCDSSTVMCVTHFPEPSTSRVRRWGDGYKFINA
jgi:glyoxylase-like metal-dependent hydrolase (beta-lactamase superfamily II)